MKLSDRWDLHCRKWRNCVRCPLHKTRRHVVLLRGSLPCDVLFIGEAPGESEDELGEPFVGPAGQTLDELISAATEGLPQLRYAFTNLVGCLPVGTTADPNEKREPKAEEIHKCSSRLLEVLELSNPGLVVHVGTLSKKLDVGKRKSVHILHPAFILRMESPDRAIVTTITKLSTAIRELVLLREET